MWPHTIQWHFLIAGFAFGLFGWLLYWAGIPLIGGIIGASAGGALGVLASDFVSWEMAPLLFLALGVVLGAVLGILLMRAIQLYFFFAAGASLGGSLVWHLLHVSAPPGAAPALDWGIVAVILLGALTGGLLLVYFRRFVVALVTSGLGCILVTTGLPEYRYKLEVGLVCLVIFLSVQIGLVRRFVEQDEFDRSLRHKHHDEDEEDYEE